HTPGAVEEAVKAGFIQATLTGDPEKIGATCRKMGIDQGMFTIIPAYSEEEAAVKGIELVASGQANILMKGLLSTDKYMRAILNKDMGLVSPKAILSHVAVMENSEYHKLLIVSDVAIIPYPDLSQKIVQTGYLIRVAGMLGIDIPKVALIAATEQVLAAIPACTDAAVISKMAERGQIPGAIVDGPLAFDVAIDRESAEIKKITSPVAGDADCLLFPNIDSGNVFYKMNTKMCHSEQAAIVMGAKVPVVLSSRGDTMLTKFYSIALAALMA
ncbi:MAG TPA: phosphate acyltransferase, partial [Prolixibacteraceae bacterium]|nr:phosphate acyltransferase [Prolixibacteraceae bacterium]